MVKGALQWLDPNYSSSLANALGKCKSLLPTNHESFRKDSVDSKEILKKAIEHSVEFSNTWLTVSDSNIDIYNGGMI